MEDALAGWKRGFYRVFFDTVIWRVFSGLRVALYTRVSLLWPLTSRPCLRRRRPNT